ERFVEVVAATLSRDPSRRISTMDELRERLRDAWRPAAVRGDVNRRAVAIIGAVAIAGALVSAIPLRAARVREAGAPTAALVAPRDRARTTGGTCIAVVCARGGSPAMHIAPLSNREREICELFAHGLTYDEVAHALGISINTVRQHVRNLYGKLDVSSKIEAV